MQASIYVADDEPMILTALVKRLSQSQHKVRACLNNSLGFGGHNGSLLLRAI